MTVHPSRPLASSAAPHAGRGPQRATWGRLLGYVRPYWRQFAVALLALLVSSALGLTYPWAIGQFTDTLTVAGSLEQLNRLVLLLLAVFLGQALVNVLQGYLITFIGERAVTDLRAQVYEHIQRQPLAFFNERQTGEITSRVTNDTALIQSSVTTNLTTLLQQSLQLVGAFVLMLLISWQLTALLLVIVPLIVALGAAFGRRIRRISTEVQDRLADASSVLEETVAGARKRLHDAREPFEIGRFRSALEQTFRAAMRRTRVSSVFGPLMGLIGFGGLSVVLWIGGRLVIGGVLTAGDLVAMLLYAGTIAASLATFTGLFTQLQQALGATERVFELLDLVPAIDDAPGAVPMPAIIGRVVFEDVSFQYAQAPRPELIAPPETPAPRGPPPAVLSGIGLVIEPGETVALVGPSGAGKSTLANLIPRFYDVTAGRILIDGQDVRQVQRRSLREQIGIVPQETLLFSGTIYDNIRYGRLDATEEAIMAAARAANAHEFVLALPDGYQSRVGERGVKLSGGQRQRVAIARAILKDPRILILDEATSSLDSESEQLVQEALERLMRGRTSIVIAHRLSTVRNADRIAVLRAGRLVEIGTHDELMRSEGLYYRLYTLQYRRGSLTVDEWTEI